ncbi:hypothetical protein MPL3356_110421 [Mesorhizobium plurifarium]|uniref:Uncharacterized protein n=1 Tax=Mesorhizobium plurifarium TaxID=69974 RepID=A0A090DAR0_MESPL|nr:hypothetical protein MPL3356_110421 [Mesorhizobium plurifarium]
MSRAVPEDDLVDLLSELSTGSDMSPAAVEAFARAHPAQREAILRFAIDWHADEWEADNEDILPFLAPDLSSYQQTVVTDPFEGKSVAELKAAANASNIPLSLLSKLESRSIAVETIPLVLIRHLAFCLGAELSTLLGFLSLKQTLPPAVQFRSDQVPEASPKIGFAEAVRNTAMDAAQRERWLTLAE